MLFIPADPPFLLTLLSYHSSSVFTSCLFHRYLSPIFPLPFHIFLHASFLSSYNSLFLSVISHLSPVYRCLVLCLSLALLVDFVFAASYFFPCFLSPYFHIFVSCLFFASFSLSSLISTSISSLVLSPLLLLASLSSC